jgi:TIR domain
LLEGYAGVLADSPRTAPGGIFISYRREETAYPAGWLFDRLVERYGSEVFKDVDSIELGDDFVDVINKAVGSCDVMLVLIGEEWLTIRDEEGRRRVDNPDDHVRLEIEAALAREVRVIPILVDGATMPRADELPPSLAKLVRRQALELSPSRFDFDTGRFLAVLDKTPAAMRTPTDPGRPYPASARLPPAPPGERAREAPAPSRLTSLLMEGARRGVLPADVLTSMGPAAPDYGPMPGGARSAPPSASAPRLPRSLLARAALLVVPLAAVAAAVRWLAGCTLDPPRASDDRSTDEPVDCTVFAPACAAPGESVLVQVFAHLPLQREEARALATEFDPGTGRRGFKSLESRVARGSTLSFHLAMPGAEVDDPVQSLVWRGRAEAVQFGVAIGAARPRTSLVGTVTASQDSVPVGHLKFRLAVTPHAASRDSKLQPVGDAARPYRTAFTSYASKDRDQVLRGVQMLRAAGIRCFQDVIDLEPGDRWERKLYSNIDRSDLFLLFWSSAAKDSTWVRKEVEYAVACKADEFDPPEIKPIILERPLVPPWPELAHLHFDDRVVYFIGRSR